MKRGIFNESNIISIPHITLLVLFFGLFALNNGSTRTGNMLWIMILATVAAVALLCAIRQRYVRVMTGIVAYSCFVVFSGLSIFWARSPLLSISGFRTAILTYAILLCAIIICGRNNVSIQEIYAIISFAGLLFVIYMCFRYGAQILYNKRGAYMGSDNLNANTFAHTYFIATVSSYICSKQPQYNQKRNYFKVLSILFGVLLMLTASKTWIISLLIFLFIINYSRINNKTLRILSIPVLLLIIVLFFVLLSRIPFLYSLIGYRFSELTDFMSGDLGKYTSTWYRFDMLSRGWSLFIQRPLFGHGINNSYFYNTYQWVYENGTYFHNNYIELLVGVGLVGTILYYVIYWLSLKSTFINRKKSSISFYSMALIISFIISDFSGVSFYYRPQILVIFFIYLTENKMIRNDSLEIDTKG